MLENFIMQVRRPKGVSSEREAFVSRTARASAEARYYNSTLDYRFMKTTMKEIIKGCTKIYPKHQRLSPVLVCYGFQILRRKESTITILTYC